jgi:hypothetical protein
MKHKILITLFSLSLMLSLGSVERVFAQIKGKVVDINGSPVTQDTLVELIPIGLKLKPIYNQVNSVSVNENGDFEFEGIPNGKYSLAINYIWSPNIDCPYPTTFYPNVSDIYEAYVFEINSEKIIEAIRCSDKLL